VAYLTDVSEIPESSFPLLQGLEVLILDTLRPRPHPTHLTVEQALSVMERLRVPRGNQRPASAARATGLRRAATGVLEKSRSRESRVEESLTSRPSTLDFSTDYACHTQSSRIASIALRLRANHRQLRWSPSGAPKAA
jgi:hypothetical protein